MLTIDFPKNKSFEDCSIQRSQTLPQASLLFRETSVSVHDLHYLL